VFAYLSLCLLGATALLLSEETRVKTSADNFYLLPSEQIQLSHIEGKGIGYGKGYTSLSGLFALDEDSIMPLLDLRGHVFDNALFAANAGLALRILSPSAVHGIYAFYDYRQMKKFHHNQASIGVERLGEFVDLRLNGYLPFGRKEGGVMKGFNGEVGLHFYETMPIALYGVMGAYYLTGEEKSVWGSSLRAAATFYNHIQLEISGSYDPLFQWIGQIKLALFALFEVRKITDSKGALLKKRQRQEIERREIIARHR